MREIQFRRSIKVKFLLSESICDDILNPILHIVYLKKQTDCGLFAPCKLKETKALFRRFNRKPEVCCKNHDILHENRQNIQF